MIIEETPLKGCVILNPRIFSDERGYFYESFNEKTFQELTGHPNRFIQDNQSYSTKGVLRGLHFQQGEHAQSKLVRVTLGEVYDVAVDIRDGSATYGQFTGVILSDKNHKQFLIPRGFAHGFVVLSDVAIFQYKCDNFYDKISEGGLHYADPSLNIDWHLPHDQLIISEKDKELPFLQAK